MRDWSRQAVVTGVGACCNLGDDVTAMGRRLRAGDHPAFTSWPPAVENRARCQVIGEYAGDVSDAALGIGKLESRFMGRAARLALKAARAAIAQAEVDPRDFGVVVGSGTGDVETHVLIQHKLEASHDCRRVAPTVVPRIMSSTTSANLAHVLRCRGPSLTATAACAGGAYNLLVAASFIESGHVDGVLAGGVEATDVHFHAGFDSMRAYNGEDNERPRHACRPYAADRGGFIFGEGGGVLVLESRAQAERRGARVLGAIRGWGMSSDGEGDMVAPSADGAFRAMASALRHAELDASDIDYVNTHGTSTVLGDVSEVRAMRRCFAGRHVPYSSTKPYTGHTITGAGAVEAIFTLAMLQGGWIAPSPNADPLDPELADYPPVREPRDTLLRFALSNSFGFGGTNVSLVLAREPHP